MSTVSTTRCDGCDVTQEENTGWLNTTSYAPYEVRHYCPKCWSGLKPEHELHREISELTATAARHDKRAEDLNALLAAAKTATYDVTQKYDVLYRERQDLKGSLAHATRRIDFLNTVERRVEALEVELSDARDEIEYDDKVNRGVIRELIGMLGRKARKRHKRRIAELLIASAEPIPPEDTRGGDIGTWTDDAEDAS